MEQRTCPVCGKNFEPRTHNQRYCTGYRGKCYRRAMNLRYRSTTETAACKGCDSKFQRARGTSQHVYCSDACHHQAKARRYGGPRVPRVTWPPEVGPRYLAHYRKQVLRSDPCPYCGESRSGGIDHIDPSINGGADGWENFAGCCPRCNATKSTLPLLQAMLWVPLSRRYHDARRIFWA